MQKSSQEHPATPPQSREGQTEIGEKPPPPKSQYIIEGARLPWVKESSMEGSRTPRK